MLPIEKGVPLPEGLRRGAIKNTLLALSPGDSFVVPPKSVSNVYARAKRLGIKICVAHRSDKSGARVWRVA
jgi:hypothetical protein